MKIAIIEPHYDDAWINLGGYILKNPEIDFYIVSLCKDYLNSANATKLLSDLLPNVQTKALALNGISWGARNRLSLMELDDYFLKLNKNISFRRKYSTIDQVNDLIANEIHHCDRVLLPLGGAHPQHIITSRFKFDQETDYYYEFPYFYSNCSLENISHSEQTRIDITDVFERKIQIFKDVYRSQIKMLLIKSHLGLLEDILEEKIFKLTTDICAVELQNYKDCSL
jgi:hypothetical protein